MNKVTDSSNLSANTSQTILLSHSSSFAVTPPSSPNTDRHKRRLKLTILSVDGIKISRNTDSPNFDHHSLAITASVSFTGSIDHRNGMRVLSSGFCCTSQRIFVESNPLIVPVGNMDSLTTTWDDNSHLMSHGEGYSREGTTMSKLILPHLYLSFGDSTINHFNDTQQQKRKDFATNRDLSGGLQGEIPASEFQDPLYSPPTKHSFSSSRSNSLLEESAFENNVEDSESSTSEINKVQMSFDTVECTNDLHDETKANPLKSSSATSIDSLFDGSDICIMNTTSEATLVETGVPEILELHVSLKVQHVPNQESCDQNDTNYLAQSSINVKSSCCPTAEGGDAISHLVLFPDIISNDSSSLSSSKATTNGRIIEMPLRRKENHKLSATLCSRRLWAMTKNPDVWVDLEENAIMTIHLQECTEEDEAVFDNDDNRIIFDCVMYGLTNQKGNVETKIDSNECYHEKGNSPNASVQDIEFHISDEQSADNQIGLNQSMLENSNDTVKEKLFASSMMLCDVFQVENVMNICSGLWTSCNEENDYDSSANVSMDSTIQTFYD